jgi:hypothetical protein
VGKKKKKRSLRSQADDNDEKLGEEGLIHEAVSVHLRELTGKREAVSMLCEAAR